MVMGFLKGVFDKPEITRAEKLAEELRHLWAQRRQLNLQKEAVSADSRGIRHDEDWTREDTYREEIVSQRIIEVETELKRLGIEVPEATL
jgi:hypothetical protein